MEKYKIRTDKWHFKIYSMWMRIGKLLGESKLNDLTSEDIGNTCLYRYIIARNILSSPLFIFCCLFLAVIFIFTRVMLFIVAVVGGFLGFWMQFSKEHKKSVWGEKRGRLRMFYPYRYCPWTKNYWPIVPWHIITPVLGFYILFNYGTKIKDISTDIFTGRSLFFPAVVVALFAVGLIFGTKLWESKFVRDSWQDIKDKVCRPVELIKPENTKS